MKVFLSYGRDDAESLAEKLKKQLEKNGYAVWLDQAEIRAGSSWESQIEEAILQSDAVLSLLTPHAVRRPSGVCLDEISFARYSWKKIIPLMVLKCRPPLGIYRLDWIDFRNWADTQHFEDCCRRLFEALESEEVNVEGCLADAIDSLSSIDYSPLLQTHRHSIINRSWLEHQIVQALAKARSAVLIGEAGTGKTSLISTLIRKHNDIVAYHLCSSRYPQSLSERTFIRSIAAQLSQQYPEFRGILQSLDLLSTAKVSPLQQLHDLLITPLHRIPVQEQSIVAIDGLDEAIRCNRTSILDTVTDFKDLSPFWLSFLFTTRPSNKVERTLAAEAQINLSEFLPQIANDISFLITFRQSRSKLESILRVANITFESFFGQIAQKSHGNLILADLLVKSVVQDECDPHEIQMSNRALSDFYYTEFRRIASNVPTQDRQSLLGVICSAQTHLTIGDLAYALGKSADACREILQPFLGFVNIQGGVVSIFHDTLRTRLLSSEALEYQIDTTDGHRRLYQLLCHDIHELPRCSYPLKNIFIHAEQSASMDYIFGAIPDCRPLLEALLQFIADHAADYLRNGTNRKIFKAIGMIEISGLQPGCAVQLIQCLYVTSCLPLCEEIGESCFRTQHADEDILGLIALTKLEMGKHMDAVEIASRIRSNRPSSEYKPPSDYVVALAHHEAGRYKKERCLLQRILNNRENLHPRWLAKALHQLGSAYSRSGSYTKAKDFYLRARAVAEPLGYVKDQALIEHELGRLLHYLGETKEALDALTQELTLLGKNMNLRDYSYSLYEKGKIFNNYGRFEDARYMLSEGLDIFISIKDRRGQVLMTREIAIGHYQSGNIDLGLSLLLSSTEIANDIGYERGSFFSRIYSAECYIQLGMGDHAHRDLFGAKRSHLYGNDMFARSCWSRAAGLVAIREGKMRVARKMLKKYGTFAQSIGYERGTIYSQLYQVKFGLTKMSDRQRASLKVRIEQYNDKRAINLFKAVTHYEDIVH